MKNYKPISLVLQEIEMIWKPDV